MLESAFYGLDLLKLHSVTTKLVGRVERLEEVRQPPRLRGAAKTLYLVPGVGSEPPSWWRKPELTLLARSSVLLKDRFGSVFPWLARCRVAVR